MTNLEIPALSSESSEMTHETLAADRARFSFVFCELDSKNAEQIAQELVDCNVLLLLQYQARDPRRTMMK